MGLTSLAALLLAAAVQDLPDLLRRLDAAERPARGCSFDLVRSDGWRASRVQLSVDGLLRFEEPWKGGEVHLLGLDDLFSWEPAPGEYWNSKPLRGARERIPLRLLPTLDLSVGWTLPLLSALVPARLLAVEPGLRVVGRSRIDGEDCVVLASRSPLSSLALLPDCMGTAKGEVRFRRFHVSLARARLLRLSFRSLWTPCWRNDLHEIGFEDWVDGVPRRIRWTTTTDASETSQESLYRVESFRGGLATADRDLLPPGDVEARWARDPSCGSRLQGHPEDPDLLYSAALRALLNADDGEGQGFEAAVPLLERAFDRRWSESVAQGLFGLYVRRGDGPRLRAFAQRISASPLASPALRGEAARAFESLGEVRNALEALPPAGCQDVRLRALLRGRDYDHALELAASPFVDASSDGFGIGRGPEGPAFLAALERALRRTPTSRLLREELVTARFEAPLSLFLDAADRAPGLGSHFLRRLRYRLIRRESENDLRAPAEDVVREKTRLLRLLAAEGKDDATAWILQASVQRRCGDVAAAAAAVAEAASRFGDLLYFREEADLLGQELNELGDPAAFERGLASILAQGRRLGAGVAELGRGIPALVRRRLAANEGGRLLDDLRGLKPQGRQYALLGLSSLEEAEKKRLDAALLAEAGRRRGDPEALLWLAASIEADEEEQGTWSVDPLTIYERVLEARPGEVAALERIARHRRRKQEAAPAVEALRKLRAAHEAGARPADPVWTTRRVDLILAEQLLKLDDRAGAEAALRRAGLEAEDLRPWELWLGAMLKQRLGDHDGALPLLRRLEEEGYRPYPALAELQEARKDWLEAMRALNRAAAWGAEPQVPSPLDRPVGGFNGRIDLTPPTPEWIAGARTRIRGLAGDLFFIRRFLAAPLPALDPAREREIAGAVDRLGSDSPQERSDAERTLRAAGPAAARLLGPLIEAPDVELRTRARLLLAEWAEPR